MSKKDEIQTVRRSYYSHALSDFNSRKESYQLPKIDEIFYAGIAAYKIIKSTPNLLDSDGDNHPLENSYAEIVEGLFMIRHGEYSRPEFFVDVDKLLHGAITAAMMLGAYQFALRHAYSWIADCPYKIEPYICASRCYLALSLPHNAFKLIDRALHLHPDRLSSLRSLKDSLKMLCVTPELDYLEARKFPPSFQSARTVFEDLPGEVFSMILHCARLDTRELCRLLRVSNLFKQFAENTPELWKHLKFVHTNTVVRKSDVWRAIILADGQMESLEIADCMSPNESRGFIRDLLSLDAPRLVPTGQLNWLEFDRQKHLKSLRSLKLEFSCDLTNDYRKALHFFGQLNVLHLNVLNFSDISPYIAECLPNLVELRLVRQYNIQSQKIQLKKPGTVWPNDPTNLKVFHFGGPTNFIDAFPYQADHGLICIVQSDFRDLIKSMPFLRELHLIGCMFDEYDEYAPENFAIDLMNWTPKLEVLNLDRSSIWPMPSIPATCVKLTCNGYTSPTPERVVRRSGIWYYHSTNILDGDRLVDDIRLNEFKRIKDLTLLSFPGGVESLFYCLARFESLESLNLNENSEVIAWGAPVSEELANFLVYDCGFSARVLSCSTSLECIGAMFPRLQKLSIAYNGMTNDSVLESLGKYFPNLQYLDLSATMVSSHGITMYLWRDSIDHRPDFMSGNALEDYIKNRLPSKHTQTLQTLVLTNCQAVDPRFYKFWKSVGAAIYTDEYVAYDSRKSHRLEQNRIFHNQYESTVYRREELYNYTFDVEKNLLA